MNFEDDSLQEQVNSLKARINTMKQSYEPAIERIQQFKTNFGVRERSDGSIIIDWTKFVPMLGVEQALELRQEIDEHYRISGEAGEKPKMRVASAAQQSA